MTSNLSNLAQHKIVSALDLDMVLDCVIENQNPLVLRKWHQGSNQRWHIQEIQNSKVTFFNAMNLKVIYSQKGSQNGGCLIRCSTAKKTENEVWEMIPFTQGDFKDKNAFYIKNLATGKVLDVAEEKAKNGQSIIGWEMKNKQVKLKSKLNQIWVIEPVSFIPDRKSLYKIFSSLDYSLVLDVSKDEMYKDNLVLFQCHKGSSQKFHIEIFKGKYLLINKEENKSVTVQNNQKGSRVKVSVTKKEDGQLWQLIRCNRKQFEGKEAFMIRSCYGMFLDISGGKVDAGSQIVQSQFIGDNGQVWYIHRI